ncbi:MAG: CHRD domain-containing protein [Phycisphaerales bacterium]
MRTSPVITIAMAALAAMATPALAEIREMVCVLSGRQQVPVNASAGTGCGRFIVDTTANTLTYRIVRSALGSAESVAHIHGAAAPGVNAAVLHALPAGDIKTGVWTYPEAQEANILNGLMYVNIHSSTFPGGEIRGQIVDMVAVLDGAQEVPANATTGGGFGLFNLNTTTNELRYYISVTSLSAPESSAHIHGFSNYGVNAPVKFPLALGALKTGVWNYAESDEDSILSGLAYVNVHSSAFPGGEIRGQITGFVNPMDRNQEVPASNTSSMGCTFCTLDRPNNQLGFDVRTVLAGSIENAAHIHGFSAPGVNSAVKFGLPLGARKLGVWNYSAADEGQIENSLSYVNVHTNVFAGGEIRGQLYFRPLPVRCPWSTDGCFGDFNNDGGIDGDDVIAFFADWDANRACADVNGDTGVDGDDVIAFFNAWDAGGVGFPGC